MAAKRPLLLALTGGLALAVAWTVVPRSAGAEPPVTMTRELPEWAAPGALLRLAGRTTAGIPVVLRIDDRVRARTVSSPRGRFRFRVRTPTRPGRYALAITAEATRLELGRLRVRPLVLAAVGDVTLGGGVHLVIRANGPRYPWRSVAPVLRAADLAVANLEGAVSTRGTPWPGKRYTFRGPPYALRPVASYAGIDVVSLANNHSLDYGRAALLDTIGHSRRFGLVPVGGGVDLRRALRPAVLVRGGLRVAFLGFSDVRPLGFDAGAETPGTAPAFPHYVRAAVRAASRRAEVVVAYLHWGAERARTPNGDQQALGQAALDAGADVVLGAHPHVLQPLERRRSRLIAWSLGNFVFPAVSPATTRTGILRIGLERRGVRSFSFRRARIHGVQPRLVR